jgi:competence protein ComFC
LKSMLDTAIKLIFPPKCIFCGNILSANSDIDICRGCFNKISFIDGIINGHNTRRSNSGCCDYIICVCHYSGIIKDSLMRYKFFSKPSYYRAFARLLTDKVKKMTDLSKFDIIISVPLHRSKEKIRGYNQSLLISKELSKGLGVPEYSRLLSRIRDTGSQSLLSKAERYYNVKDAFEICNVEMIKDKVVLLVDDIMTTGNTIDECSRILKAAGAKAVVGAVIATGRVLPLKNSREV